MAGTVSAVNKGGAMYKIDGRYPKEDVAEIKKAKKLLLDMSKKSKLELINIFRAASWIIDGMIERTILNLRKQGYGIKKIARLVHIDDRKVSAIVKSNVGKPEVASCPVNPTKPACKPNGACNKLQLSDVGKIYEMKCRCYSVKEIAKALHKSDRFVAKVIAENGWKDVGITEVRILRGNGWSVKKIARKLHISERIVSRVVNPGR